MVIMIKNVLMDLKIFMLFYIILIFMFSLILGIIGFGNPNIRTGIKLIEIEKVPMEFDGLDSVFFQNFLMVLRYSVGDFGDFA